MFFVFFLLLCTHLDGRTHVCGYANMCVGLNNKNRACRRGMQRCYGSAWLCPWGRKHSLQILVGDFGLCHLHARVTSVAQRGAAGTSPVAAPLPVQLPPRVLQQSRRRCAGRPETRSAQRPDHVGYRVDCILQPSARTSLLFCCFFFSPPGDAT